MNARNGLVLSGLRRWHPGAARAAVDGLSLALAPGELMALLGPSGCGKSTVLRQVAGLEPLDGGQVLLDGDDLGPLPPSARPIGLVFQGYALFPHRSVLGNVAYGLEALGLPAEAVRPQALAALDRVGLLPLAERRPDQLSGGQQQRVALARALAPRPRVLLLDEPLANLDAGLRRQLREDIRALQREARITALYVTHDQAEALAVSDRIAVMDQGRLLQVDTPRALHDSPADETVARFWGEGRLFDACADGQDGLWIEPAGVRVAVDAPLDWACAQPRRILVRPSAWRLAPPSTRSLAGRIRRRSYLGHRMEYEVATELGDCLVVDPGTACPREVGAPLSLVLHRAALAVVGPPR